MLLEMKLKKAAMLAALDITLARMQKSPERCARNLLELGSPPTRAGSIRTAIRDVSASSGVM
jgi:hypothetical protein